MGMGAGCICLLLKALAVVPAGIGNVYLGLFSQVQKNGCLFLIFIAGLGNL